MTNHANQIGLTLAISVERTKQYYRETVCCTQLCLLEFSHTMFDFEMMCEVGRVKHNWQL